MEPQCPRRSSCQRTAHRRPLHRGPEIHICRVTGRRCSQRSIEPAVLNFLGHRPQRLTAGLRDRDFAREHISGSRHLRLGTHRVWHEVAQHQEGV